MDSHLQALSSGTVPVSDSEIAALRGALRGSVLLPVELCYDAARAILLRLLCTAALLWLLQTAGLLRTVALLTAGGL